MPYQATKRKGACIPREPTPVAEQPQASNSRTSHLALQQNPTWMVESLQTRRQQESVCVRVSTNLEDALAMVLATPSKQREILGEQINTSALMEM